MVSSEPATLPTYPPPPTMSTMLGETAQRMRQQALDPEVKGAKPITVQFEKYQVRASSQFEKYQGQWFFPVREISGQGFFPV